MKSLASAALFLSLAVPAFAGEPVTATTPPPVVPQAAAPALTALPQSQASEAQPLSVPETAATGTRSHGCHGNSTVYLTN